MRHQPESSEGGRSRFRLKWLGEDVENMKTLKLLTIMIVLAVWTFIIIAQERSQALKFQEAINLMETKGDYRAAIRLFEEVSEGTDRNLAARSLLYLGLCYEKLDKEKARQTYQRIIKEFADHREVVTEAKTKISALGRAPSSSTASSMAVQQVFVGPGIDVRKAASPDGRYLSYVDRETGDLAVLELATGKSRRLTNKGSWPESMERAGSSKFSPDGKQVAYSWGVTDNFFNLCTINLDGTAHRLLYRNEELTYIVPNDWSPDGNYILATLFKKDDTKQVVLVSVADGSVRVLKNIIWQESWGAFSPDGRYIAYNTPQQGDSQKHDIFLFSLDEKREIPLVEHPADDRLLGWAPGGKWILFSSNRTGTLDAWIIPVADGKAQGDPQLIKIDIGRISPIGFTQKGSFYYSKWTWMFHIYVAKLNLKTGEILIPPKKETQRIVPFNSSPDLSADGKYLAFISSGALGSSSPDSAVISIRSLQTGQEREIPSPELANLYRLRWFPDGRSILVHGLKKKGRWGFYKIDTQTGDVSGIVQEEPDIGITDPAGISPDGKTIFYRRIIISKKLHQILARDIETGQEREIYSLAAPALVMNPVLSPDGRHIVFFVDDQQKRALLVVPVSGGEARELLRVSPPENINYISLTWTPDGKQILFGKSNAQSGDKSELWRIPLEDGEPQKLGLTIDYLFHLRVHLDGKRVSYTADESQTEIYAMENFLPEEKRLNKSESK